jgi:hypothetical protein
MMMITTEKLLIVQFIISLWSSSAVVGNLAGSNNVLIIKHDQLKAHRLAFHPSSFQST